MRDGQAVFAFDCARFGRFEERVWFPGHPLPGAPDEGTAALLTLLHAALGVSTYKAGAAREILLPPLGPAGRVMIERLYTEGLAEFFVRAGLPYPPHTRFEGEVTAPAAPPAPSASGALVAFGGGKDSYVARAVVAGAGEEAALAAVVMADTVRDAIGSCAPPEDRPYFARRTLDPKLAQLEGAFGGHVPITAINMLVLALLARLTGKASVVFANERSADEPTMTLPDGTPANHQDSKSGAFEALMRDALTEVRGPAVLSVLRPYSEVWIARAFSRLTDAHPRFTSCNRNFRLAGDAEERWCGACGKCAFTSLVLSPWLSRDEAARAFDGTQLDAPALLPFWEQLLGLTDTKPWDCVGTIAECRASLWRLSSQQDWRDSLAVRTYLPRVLQEDGEAALGAAWEAALAPVPVPGFPDRYARAAETLA